MSATNEISLVAMQQLSGCRALWSQYDVVDDARVGTVSVKVKLQEVEGIKRNPRSEALNQRMFGL